MKSFWREQFYNLQKDSPEENPLKILVKPVQVWERVPLFVFTHYFYLKVKFKRYFFMVM